MRFVSVIVFLTKVKIKSVTEDALTPAGETGHRLKNFKYIFFKIVQRIVV